MNQNSLKLIEKAMELENTLGSRAEMLARMHHMQGDILGRVRTNAFN